ncbi:MAG: MinD/ParA family protein [Deltaproteobacteria bacterium]|nr:MinD/ParA family protein [Deltaproteobacteria bacterium]MBW1718209.1 MinD/ParA family protein [Deltaproteobacteria bacterium]
MKGIDRDVYSMSLRNRQKKRNKDVRVIAITSGKGGVGKTNIAANFAYIFSKMGERVLLLDADTGLANIDIILGITPKYSLFHVLHGEKTLSEATVQGPGGVKILPAASGIQEMAELSKDQKLTLLEELDGLNESLDFMLIDTAAGIAKNVMYFNMVAEEIVVVVSPEPTSLTDAYALIKLLYKGYSAKRFMLLVNMVTGPNEAKEVYRRLNNATDHFLNLSLDYLGYILFDKTVREAVKQQTMLVKFSPHSKASKCLFTVAKKLCQERPEDYESGTTKFSGGTNANRYD